MGFPLQHLPDTVRALIRSNHGTYRGWIRTFLAQTEWALGRVDPFVSLADRQVRRLVFVCLGNINRSAFAHAVALRQGLACASIGLATTTGAPAFPTAVKTAVRFGIDLSQHRATDFSDYQKQEGDLLLAMEIRHVHRLIRQGVPARSIVLLGAWSSPRRLHLHDPHTLSDEYFLTCFTLLHAAVLNLAVDLRTAGQPVAHPV